ncbi:hypothetical protein GCM10008922_13800 [Faecalicatena contorta]
MYADISQYIPSADRPSFFSGRYLQRVQSMRFPVTLCGMLLDGGGLHTYRRQTE